MLTIRIPAANGSDRSSFSTLSVARHPCEPASQQVTHSLVRVAAQQDERGQEILGRHGRQGDSMNCSWRRMNRSIDSASPHLRRAIVFGSLCSRCYLLGETDSDNDSSLAIASRSYILLRAYWSWWEQHSVHWQHAIFWFICRVLQRRITKRSGRRVRAIPLLPHSLKTPQTQYPLLSNTSIYILSRTILDRRFHGDAR